MSTNDSVNETNEKKDQADQEKMTPWQKEHLLYLQQHGQEPPEEKQVPEENFELETEETAIEDFEKVETADPQVVTESVDSKAERVSFADRLPKIKAFRNKKLRRELTLLTLLFLLPLALLLYYISPLSSLSKISVTGNQRINEQAIIADSDLNLHQNLWQQYFSRSKNEAKIVASSLWIKDAQISLSHVNQFAITISEYPEVALLAKGEYYYPILENGQIADEKSKEASKGKVIFEGFTESQKILATLKAYHQLSSELQVGVSQIKYAPTDTNQELLNIYMNDGNEVIVNISNLVSQLTYYPQVVKEMDGKGIIDMEVGIFTYPYPSKKADDEK